MKLTDYTPHSTQSVLVYGPPKVGKTQLVGELARHGKKLIWFDLENGAATLTKLPLEAKANVELISIPDTKAFPIAIETCGKVIKGAEVSICEEHGKVACPICKMKGLPSVSVALNNVDSDTIVVFDSLTQLTDSAIAHITKDRPEDYKLDYDDWAKLGKLMATFLSHIQQAKFNVVCISHETEAEMEDGKNRLVPVAGTRNFSRNTAKCFGHVIYSQVSAGRHKFTSSTTGVANVSAGSRTDVVTEKMEAPSLISIFNTVAPVTSAAQTNGQKAASSLSGLLIKKA